jgi:hypothetical protein
MALSPVTWSPEEELAEGAHKDANDVLKDAQVVAAKNALHGGGGGGDVDDDDDDDGASDTAGGRRRSPFRRELSW